VNSGAPGARATLTVHVHCVRKKWTTGCVRVWQSIRTRVDTNVNMVPAVSTSRAWTWSTRLFRGSVRHCDSWTAARVCMRNGRHSSQTPLRLGQVEVRINIRAPRWTRVGARFGVSQRKLEDGVLDDINGSSTSQSRNFPTRLTRTQLYNWNLSSSTAF
jgi:hypothetical protein